VWKQTEKGTTQTHSDGFKKKDLTN
jgi:hypothetical protein